MEACFKYVGQDSVLPNIKANIENKYGSVSQDTVLRYENTLFIKSNSSSVNGLSAADKLTFT